MIPDLRRRIGLTLGALLICRIGANIPLPGLDSSALMEVLRSPGPAGMPGMLAGAGIRRVAILALGITPYLSSAVLLQIVMIVSRRMRAVSERGEIGRRSILRWTLALAAAIAAFQAYGVAVAIEGVAGLAPAPGLLFRLMVVATLTGGALFLAWLAELITARGIGNGLALILLLQVVTDVPDTLADVLTFNRQGLLSGNVVLGLGMIVVASTALVAFVELSCRRLPLIFSARGGTGGRQSYLAVKLNAAGAVIPVVLASWIMVAVTTVAIFGTGRVGAWWAAIAPELEQGRPLHLAVYALVIMGCALFYTAFVLDPDAVAKRLAQHGGAVAGVEPGEATAAHVDRVVSRTAIIGALYLAAVCLLPQVLIFYARVPLAFGGPSLLIMVCAIMDLDRQVRGEAAMNAGRLTHEADPARAAGRGKGHPGAAPGR